MAVNRILKEEKEIKISENVNQWKKQGKQPPKNKKTEPRGLHESAVTSIWMKWKIFQRDQIIFWLKAGFNNQYASDQKNKLPCLK